MRYFLLLSTVLFFSTCSFLDSSKKVGDQYLAILQQLEKDPEGAIEAFRQIISSADKGYLRLLSNVYTAKEENAWREYLQESDLSSIEITWFYKSLRKKITDAPDFENYVLEDVMRYDAKIFREANYLETVEIASQFSKVMYASSFNSKVAIGRSLSFAHFEGETKLLLVPNIERYNKEMKSSQRMMSGLLKDQKDPLESLLALLDKQ